jgi:hypothetical protein
MGDLQYFIGPVSFIAAAFVVRELFIRYVRDARVCPIWSDTLNTLMDADAEVGCYGITTKIGNVKVWTANWPFAYGHEATDGDYAMPNYATQKRLRDYIARKRAIKMFDELKAPHA